MNVINANIKVKDKIGAFEIWLKLTKALHDLTNEEIRVLAVFLAKRHELSKKINDNELLDEYLFSTKIKKDVETYLGIESVTKLPNIISSFRRKGVMMGNSIKPQFAPNLSSDFNSYILSFKVEIDDKG